MKVGNVHARFRLLIAVLLLAPLFCAAGAAGAADMAPGPRISVVEPLYDFGPVAAGAVLEHVFEIRNTGVGVLEIRKVAPS